MQWIPEIQAAQMVLRKPETLRKKVKSGAWNIAYTAPEGRKFMYSKNDLEKFLEKYSTKIK